MNKLDKTKIRIIHKGQIEEFNDDGFITGEPSYLISVVEELTKDAWAFRGENAERRLQRDVVNIYRKKVKYPR